MPKTIPNRRAHAIAARAMLPILLLVACGDPTGFNDPFFASDTLTIATPTEANWGRPTAVDVTANGIYYGGARFPEQARDAGLWDLALREYGRSLILVPAGVIGFESGAAISPALDVYDFDGLASVPTGSGLSAEIPAVLHLGRVYVARSRLIECYTGGGAYAGYQYAKLQPVEIDVEAGTVRLVVTSNPICDDWRLR